MAQNNPDRRVVPDWSVALTEEVFGGAPFAIGDTVKTPDGRTVRITGGQYWGTYGLSNFWDWREVLPDGSLSSVEECGYGWSADTTREQWEAQPWMHKLKPPAIGGDEIQARAQNPGRTLCCCKKGKINPACYTHGGEGAV